jgi:hypothetical protein
VGQERLTSFGQEGRREACLSDENDWSQRMSERT